MPGPLVAGRKSRMHGVPALTAAGVDARRVTELRKDEGKCHSNPDGAGVGMSPDDSVLLATIANEMRMDEWRA